MGGAGHTVNEIGKERASLRELSHKNDISLSGLARISLLKHLGRILVLVFDEKKISSKILKTTTSVQKLGTSFVSATYAAGLSLIQTFSKYIAQRKEAERVPLQSMRKSCSF